MKTLLYLFRRIGLWCSFILGFALFDYVVWCAFEIFGDQDPLLKHRGPLKLFPLAVVAWLALLFYWLWYNTTVRSPRRAGTH